MAVAEAKVKTNNEHHFNPVRWYAKRLNKLGVGGGGGCLSVTSSVTCVQNSLISRAHFLSPEQLSNNESCLLSHNNETLLIKGRPGLEMFYYGSEGSARNETLVTAFSSIDQRGDILFYEVFITLNFIFPFCFAAMKSGIMIGLCSRKR